VSAASGTTTFTMSSTIGWSVVDDAAWLTATKIDGSTISVSYDANLSLSFRTANIKASGTGVEETVTVTQAAAILGPIDPDDIEIPIEIPEVEISDEIPEIPELPAPADPFDVSPNSSSVSADSGTITFTVNSTVGWSVVVLPQRFDDGGWLTATKIDGSTISVSYEANLSLSSRTAYIKASGTGGVKETVTVTQSCWCIL
jgi:hypothetical protein